MSLKLLTFPKAHLYFCVLIVTMSLKAFTLAFPAVPEDDRFVDREFASPGGHQLASWLISKLRKVEEFIPVDDEVSVPTGGQPMPPYRLPLNGKRNSELTSVMMGFPKSMIDNGRK